jgi:hypothetical protein
MNGSSILGEDIRVEKTIFLTHIDSALTLTLVEYSDGRLGILRNGAAISRGPWHNSELSECIDLFQQLSHAAAGQRN